jgi:hypothetical protein
MRPEFGILFLILGCSGPARPAATDSPGPRPAVEEQGIGPLPLRAAEVLERLTPEGRAAFDCLRASRRFTDGAIDYGGDVPREVIALRILWREDAARDAFELLLDHAAEGGQLFALCGLYYTDAERFEQEVALRRESSALIRFQSGCSILEDQPVGELVLRTQGPAVRLASRDQRVKAFRAARPENASAWLDIAGGGYSDTFRHGGGYHQPRTMGLDEGVD